MSAQGNIVINDGTSPTPVARTFAPKGARVSPDKKEVAIWRDQSTASAVGYRTLTEQHTPVNSNGRRSSGSVWIFRLWSRQIQAVYSLLHPLGPMAPSVL